MSDSTSYDVIVVGLGAMGSATLYQLAKRGVRALGIDRFDPPHTQGSTHGETRITRLAVGEGPQYMPLVRRSHEIWRELEAQTGIRLLAETGGTIVCPVGGGSWHHGVDFVERTIELAKAQDIPYEYLDNAQLAARRPGMNLKGNEHAVMEQSAGIAFPENAVRAQLQEAERLGATILRNTLVTSVDEIDGMVQVCVEGGGVFSAEKTVLTAGPWMQDFLPQPQHANVRVCRQVIHWFEATEIDSYREDSFPWIIWISDTLEEYLCLFPIMDAEGQSVKVMTEQFLDNVHPDDVERAVSEAETADIYDRLISQRLHGFTGRCIRSIVCLYTMTPDDHFTIDYHPDSKHIVFASPCSGHGFKHSAAIGEGLADMVTVGRSRYDFSSFSLQRFNQVKSGQ